MSIESLISAYRTALRADGKSPSTLEWHRHCLNAFASWLRAGNHPEHPDGWSPALLRLYLVHLSERRKANGDPLSATSAASMAGSLRSFCAWLHHEELAERDPFARLKPPRAPKLVKPTLTWDEVAAVLREARDGRRTPLRDEAILLFLLDTGARANEVCTLAADGIDWERRIAKLFGKGARERYVPFSPQTARAIQRYAARERRGSSGRLFESEEGRPLTPSGLLQLCRRLGDRVNVELHPHKCRHTFAITYLRNGASVFAVQKVLGHTTLDVTLRYAALLTDDLVKEHELHSPVAALLSRSRR
ncbi:MAG: tyrosine-type recombinase/integrase [Chloroflexota bacterium]|nr:tyrosine-type recombinase/integrase [Chloroflexota bacterium]